MIQARMRALMLFAVIMVLSAAKNLSVMVIGDSWGTVGPSWHALQHMFDSHSVNATVRSAAISGTKACDWAKKKGNMILAANGLFPEEPEGPDFIWYTLGGNDMTSRRYVQCSQNATSIEAQKECMALETAKITNCSIILFDAYFKVYPKTRILQCGYDIPCFQGKCAYQLRNVYCAGNYSCQNECKNVCLSKADFYADMVFVLFCTGTKYWQGILLNPLAEKYSQYTGIDILGTVQQAGGVANASTGMPVMNEGSPCSLMEQCVHPVHKGATAVGEAFWNLYFSKQLNVTGADEERGDMGETGGAEVPSRMPQRIHLSS
jgi:hypothetical protein